MKRAAFILTCLLVSSRSFAAPPPPTSSPPPIQPAPEHGGEPPPPGYGQSDPNLYPAGQAQAQVAVPTDLPPVPPVSQTHGPQYSVWVGARASYVGFGFSFYDNEKNQPETSGNYLGNGIAPQVDIGARLAYRFVPYIFYERGFMAQGHRFENTSASSTTDFYGVGFRYITGDVDTVGFLTDLSIGRRVVSISNNGQSYSMSGFEYFRLGFGAEIRVSTLFAISPLLSISSGAFGETSGSINFGCAPNCPDGVNAPTYQDGKEIATSRAYVVLSLGVGLHFDLFGQ